MMMAEKNSDRKKSRRNRSFAIGAFFFFRAIFTRAFVNGYVCIPFDINHDCVIHYFEVLSLRVISLVNIGSELAARTCGKSLNEIKSTVDKAANKNLFYFRQIDSQIRIDMIICQSDIKNSFVELNTSMDYVMYGEVVESTYTMLCSLCT